MEGGNKQDAPLVLKEEVQKYKTQLQQRSMLWSLMLYICNLQISFVFQDFVTFFELIVFSM